MEQIKALITELIRKGWFSLLLLPLCWMIVSQTWMALKWEISFAYMTDFVFPFSIIYLMLDAFLLIIHEAGHTFFGVFGWRFLTILGGSLLEILLPLGIAFFGFFTARKVLTQFGLFLTGLAWLDTAAYAYDAFERRMPLIGNLPESAHDFYNLFSEMKVLHHHVEIAWAFYWAGVLLLLMSLLFPVYYYRG